MTSQELFYEALKAKRRAMGAANRKKSKKGGVKPADQWIYPAHVENKYFKYISALQKKIIAPTTLMVKNNLDKWISEYKTDGIIKDNLVPFSVVDQDEQNIIDHKQALYDIENPKKKKKSLFSLFKKSVKKDTFSNEIAEEMTRLQGIVNELYGENAPTIKAFITSIGQDVSDFNMKQYQKYMKGILGVEFVATEAWETEVIAAWTDVNFSLIQKLSNEYITSINTIVSEGVQFGATTDEIMRQIRATNKNISDARSRLIARDQVGKLNGLLTERRMTDAGIDMYTWLTAGDERVRSKHKTMNGKLCRWDNNSVYSKDGGKTWIPRTSDMTKSIPGQDIQCFLGNTKITSPIPTQKLFRRLYTGKATIFTLSNGTTFTCTFNHPILRSDGTMCPAHLLNVGDNLISVSPDRDFSFLEGNQKDTIPTIKELFDFSTIIAPMSITSTQASDFHGDGVVNQKVDIISFEDELPIDLKSIIDKKLIEEFLTKADMGLSGVLGCSRSHLMLHSLGFPECSFISFFCKLLSLRKSIGTESSEISHRTISKLNTILKESDSNTLTRDIIFFGQEENTFTREILSNDLFYRNLFSIGCKYFMMDNSVSHGSEFFRKIVGLNVEELTKINQVHTGDIPTVHILNKRISELSVHVYNLQNSNSWYMITDSGLIVKNCRCTALPYFEHMIGQIDEELEQENK